MTATFPPGRKVDEFTGPRLTLDSTISAMSLEALAPTHPFHHCSMALLGKGDWELSFATRIIHYF